ncbi:recombinase family protein [Streptosporangium canum]
MRSLAVPRALRGAVEEAQQLHRQRHDQGGVLLRRDFDHRLQVGAGFVGFCSITTGPLDAALTLCRDIKSAAPGQTVIFTVHELKRPARNAAELMALAIGLQTAGIQLELLTGPLTGIYDPNGLGAMLFAVLVVSAQLDRDYIRDKPLEGQQIAASRGHHGGRPKVIDDDMLTFALTLRAQGVPVPEIAAKLTITTGKNAGKRPSVASLYRALADADAAGQQEHDSAGLLPLGDASV